MWTGFCTAGAWSAILSTWLGRVCPSPTLPHLASSVQLVSLGSCPVLFTGLWEAGGEEGRPLSWVRVATCIPHSCCRRKWMPERGTPAAKRKGFTEARQMILHSCKNSPLEFLTDFCYKTSFFGEHDSKWCSHWQRLNQQLEVDKLFYSWLLLAVSARLLLHEVQNLHFHWCAFVYSWIYLIVASLPTFTVIYVASNH